MTRVWRFLAEVWRAYTPLERALMWLCLGVALFCAGWIWSRPRAPEPPFFRDVANDVSSK